MRVAIIAPFHDFGGSEHQLLLLLRALPAQGVTVLFCHFNIRSDALRAELQSLGGCESIQLEVRSFRNPLNLWRSASALARRLREREVQVVHCWNYSGHIVGGIGSALARIPSVFSMGGLDPWKKSWQMPFYWALNRLPRAFVFQSQTERDVVCRRERIPQRRARIIPNGVDRTRFNVGNRAQARQRLSTELGLEEDVPVILSVGSLRPIKGHDILIRALHKLHERCPALPFQALIVGEGPLLNEYKTMARTLPLVFSGFREDVEWLYQAAAVYCQPSRSEGLPNAVIEAMCCGLPIVAADVGGLRELVGPDNGALFKPEDVDGLASRLEVMLTRGDKLTAMRQASELRSARFLDRAMVEQYLQLYERVGGEKSARVG